MNKIYTTLKKKEEKTLKTKKKEKQKEEKIALLRLFARTYNPNSVKIANVLN